ncbi:hypothetical protein GWK36_05340 [Caldichromatium japonicum]|uniref:DUF4304 domain-containing protein n=1 Tax=Caldichromatium japonicum TaxID=2699430 RepID=A0A6G7VCC1_9GAMM|nr:hypothetical protein [Caldichromatium japonicum]QIK37498.1 hypothetical protein GWK36_05340 [Caldichromatium japonicum]
MSREGDLMRKALRRHLLPALAHLGFVGKSSKFQRLLPDWQDLLAIQYFRYGGSFILEFGRRERGPLSTSWGPVVPEEKLDVVYISPGERGRLQETEAEARDLFAGFSFEGFGEDFSKYEALAMRVATLLPQVDAWLSQRVKGPNIHAL